jgi:hypothetical protein
MGRIRACKRITSCDDSLKKALVLPVDDFDKLLQASTGKNG